jgi:hypothetical protein
MTQSQTTTLTFAHLKFIVILRNISSVLHAVDSVIRVSSRSRSIPIKKGFSPPLSPAELELVLARIFGRSA